MRTLALIVCATSLCYGCAARPTASPVCPEPVQAPLWAICQVAELVGITDPLCENYLQPPSPTGAPPSN